MNRTFLDKGRDHVGADFQRDVAVPLHGHLVVDSQGQMRGISRNEIYTGFPLLPATSIAATSDPWFLLSGTGTEVIARATKGGINIKSQASTPADGDNVLLAPGATTTALYTPIRAQSQPRFETRVALNKITAMFFSCGFNENITDADPTGTAGEGAMFFFDPTGEFASTMTGYTTNWGVAHKVDGADTFTNTGIPVVAGVDYELVIALNALRKAEFYINGVLVATGPALTADDILATFYGLELTATPGEQKDVDIRYASVSRLIGG